MVSVFGPHPSSPSHRGQPALVSEQHVSPELSSTAYCVKIALQVSTALVLALIKPFVLFKASVLARRTQSQQNVLPDYTVTQKGASCVQKPFVQQVPVVLHRTVALVMSWDILAHRRGPSPLDGVPVACRPVRRERLGPLLNALIVMSPGTAARAFGRPHCGERAHVFLRTVCLGITLLVALVAHCVQQDSFAVVEMPIK